MCWKKLHKLCKKIISANRTSDAKGSVQIEQRKTNLLRNLYFTEIYLSGDRRTDRQADEQTAEP